MALEPMTMKNVSIWVMLTGKW